jgi:peptidoglycan/xylan/chitin deacetylase (PgdA/CDA1 family)
VKLNGSTRREAIFRLATIAVLVLALIGAGTAVVLALQGRSGASTDKDTASSSVTSLAARPDTVSSGPAGSSSSATSLATHPGTDPTGSGQSTSSTLPELPARLPASAKALSVPILMYHLVDTIVPDAGPYSEGLTVPKDHFEAQMDYLAENGYHPVTLEQIYAAMAGLGALPAKPVAITFDDGYKDNFTVAFPILQSHRFVATFFVLTSHVGGAINMTWDELREMQAQGMAIEPHGVHHPNLTTLSSARLREELVDSRASILEMLGSVSRAYCYPGGAYDQTVIAAVKDAGYLVAVTTHNGKTLDPDHTYEWPRIRVTRGESVATFASHLE